MDDYIALRRLSTPITTGIPQQIPTEYTEKVPQESFKSILDAQINKESESKAAIDSMALNSLGVNFSRHAMNRVIQRNIDLSDENLSRLNEGIRLAGEKGLDDTLILIDSAAYIVSVKNNMVITTVANEELQGNVFTNIDGTVVI
ncbi:MAG: flagellar protein [Oscillospiraceae bacterium]|nr:flagellar protein [Oscillospiraceae bacterium]